MSVRPLYLARHAEPGRRVVGGGSTGRDPGRRVQLPVCAPPWHWWSVHLPVNLRRTGVEDHMKR